MTNNIKLKKINNGWIVEYYCSGRFVENHYSTLGEALEFIQKNAIYKDGCENVMDIMRPAPKHNPVVEGWLEYCSNVYSGAFRDFDLPKIKIRYDPNKKSVESITILDVKNEQP